jgi:hypothetical protein
MTSLQRHVRHGTPPQLPHSVNYCVARFTGSYSYDEIIELALSARGDDRLGYRADFINLVRLAKSATEMEGLQY